MSVCSFNTCLAICAACLLAFLMALQTFRSSWLKGILIDMILKLKDKKRNFENPR